MLFDSFYYIIFWIFLKTFIITGIIDVILKNLVSKKISFLILHTIFNIYITFVVWNNAIRAIFYPLNIF